MEKSVRIEIWRFGDRAMRNRLFGTRFNYAEWLRENQTTFRCTVNFTATEETTLMAMHEQSGVASLSSFIKMQLFGKTFKIHHIDDNTRIFIDKLSSLNAHYRTIGVEYNSVVKQLRQHFTEKKAMQALYN